MIRIRSTVSETGTDENGNYWTTSYARSRNNDIMDNFRIEFYQMTDSHGAQMGVVTIKLGTIRNMSDVLTNKDLANLDEQYEHLIGAALSSLQKVFKASEQLV